MIGSAMIQLLLLLAALAIPPWLHHYSCMITAPT
jgi:hypothetical protein